ncbi:probable polyamine acetyltransferase [Rhynchosporium secalis]|uniref:Probable polyamine acetyltransferase n=1 Tax=Rhynchosporium secalis TaxID=38038 RepID=A0A1E1M3U4_RHYSE|nr:probable polyamine acetyltransferase [Rhynchosporium secalis]
MPRDLKTERSTPPIQLTESPNSVTTERSESPSPQEDAASPSTDRQRQKFVIVPEDQQVKAPANLHPYTRPLTISDLESCLALENAAFTNPEERASREKFKYRLSKCGELCYGIFCTVVPKSGFQIETIATGKPVESSRKNGAISVLLGHVVSTKTNDAVATDDSMGIPEDWDSTSPKPSRLGHQEDGRNIVMHSVAVLPGFQGRGIGRVLMMSYMQHMNGAGIADRLSLIAHDHKTSWYEKLGFTNVGKSEATFGGGNWIDMGFHLKSLEARTSYG